MSSRSTAFTALSCCAAALVAAVPAAAAAPAWKHFPAVHAAKAAPAPAPKTILRRVETAFSRQAPPSADKRDLSPLMRQLAIALPRLHGADRTRAGRLLARPSEGSGDPQQNGWSVHEAKGSPVCSAHFCVHWVPSGKDAPPLADSNNDGVPDWIDTVVATNEHVYSVENGDLGWPTPRSDGTAGGSSQTDVYLEDVGDQGIYGYAAPDPQPSRKSQFAYLVLDNDFNSDQFPPYASPVDPLDVTMAHEYNHVLQFGIDTDEQTWMLESTAVWMEGKVYDPVHDYLQYLPTWVGLGAQPITFFNQGDSSDPGNGKVYGSSVWNKWLDQHYGQDSVRDAWNDSVAAGSFAPGAYDASIKQHGGVGFSDEFSRFAAASAEWQAQNSGFPEGELWPDVNRAGSLSIDHKPGTIPLDHTTYAVIDVPVTSAPQIKLSVAAPSGTSSGIALVGLQGGDPGGTQVGLEKPLPNGGHGTITFSNPGNLSRLSAVLVNSDVKHGSFSDVIGDFSWQRDGQSFYADVSTDFTRPQVQNGVVSPKKLTIRFSEPVRGISSNSFRVAGVKGRLSFTKGTSKASFIPRHPFKKGHHYRVLLGGGITDLALNRLVGVTVPFKG
jgi:hypothetical protein